MNEPSLWWFIPAFALALFMLEAMMQFTASLLQRRPRRRKRAVDMGELRSRLLALNSSRLPYRIEQAEHGALTIHWNVANNAWTEGLAKVKVATVYRARMLLDSEEREVRWFESVRSGGTFLGFDGLRPRFVFDFWYRSGLVNVVMTGRAYEIESGFPPRLGKLHEFELNTIELKEGITKAITASGWSFRPVALPFYVSPRWVAFGRRIVPDRIRRIPRRRLWGVLYPVSYALFFGYLLALVGPEGWDRHNLLIIGGISAGWWGIWGLISWLLMGLPGLNSRKRTRRKRTTASRRRSTEQPPVALAGDGSPERSDK